MDMAGREGINVLDFQGVEDSTIDAVIDWIYKPYTNEQLFKIKLRLFEHDKVKESTDTKKKSVLRKTKSVPEMLEAYSKF